MKERGFTIIELIITIAILSFGIIGVYGAFYPAISLAYNISHRLTAANLAQEGLEIVRNIRDNNFIASSSNPEVLWYAGLLGCETGCQADYKTGTSSEGQSNQLSPYNPNNFLKITEDGLYGYDTGVDTMFKRQIIIHQESTDVLKVTALVAWDYNGQPFSFEVDAYLYNWY